MYKKTKLAIASLLLVSLSACASNNVNQGQRNIANRNVSTGDLNRPNDLNRPFHNMNVSNENPMFSSVEIQPLNNGFIPIQPNSYSTATPSSMYPDTNVIKRGQYWYYSFQPQTIKPKTNMLQQRPYSGFTTPPAQKKVTPTQPAPIQPTVGINQTALKVIELTNAERKKNGLPALKADSSLSKVAQTKTNDMETKHYFSHTSPTYGSPFDMMRDFGITYRTAGENIAMGQPTPQQVVTAWMNSEGHRRNILDPNYTNIGVGYNSTGNYWSQMFIGK